MSAIRDGPIWGPRSRARSDGPTRSTAPRERYLSVDELGRLGEVLRECEQEGIESQSAINALRLLIFTGCRLTEIQTLKWD